MKNYLILFALVLFFAVILSAGNFTLAQDDKDASDNEKLNYENALILDSDLDGLTDLGEEKFFKTDPTNPDSDGDGFYDGVEIINKTNPSDNTSPSATMKIKEESIPVQKEIPWAWYVVRVSGIMAFFLLYIVMFLGLSIRTPILRKIIKPINSLNIHAWLSVQALMFVFIHGGALLFDKLVGMGILDITIPFISDFRKNEVALGILGMYIMMLLILTSYFKHKMSATLWRFTHYLNMVLYVIVVLHSLMLGTDLKEGSILRDIFIYANVFLSVIIVVNIATKIITKIRSNKIIEIV